MEEAVAGEVSFSRICGPAEHGPTRMYEALAGKCCGALLEPCPPHGHFLQGFPPPSSSSTRNLFKSKSNTVRYLNERILSWKGRYRLNVIGVTTQELPSPRPAPPRAGASQRPECAHMCA